MWETGQRTFLGCLKDRHGTLNIRKDFIMAKKDETYKIMKIDNSSIEEQIDLVAAEVDELSEAVEDLDPTDYAGYDDTKTQTLKNIEGTLTWVTDEE